MKKTIYIATVIILFVIIWSCETDITVDLPTPQKKLVVEGFIESNNNPYVFLTKNSGYFDPVDSTSLYKMLILDSTTIPMLEQIGFSQTEIELFEFAEELIITVTELETSIIDTLKPSIIPYFPFFGYVASSMTGNNNNSYKLDINYNGSHYFGTTTIPEPVPIDSIWFTTDTAYADTLGTIGIRFIDPPQIGNFYAIHNMVEGEHLTFLKPYFGISIIDDRYLNGDTLKFTGITKAQDNNDFFEGEFDPEADWWAEGLFSLNSIVNIRLSTIDTEHFLFWNSWSRHLATDGNPFVNPASIMSNLHGENVLGVWGGYGTYIERVHITDSATLEILSNKH
ncbi:MAG TPA: DUF4249 family protein [Bacteroidales bacterium]|jgi:hypothetical protein|nr:DUF4249 family protein [Bacteroidales bacterium]MDD4235205.1 DUF4249 family protein [Bacteroidales bacterium]HRW20595.1 DUF4249 family protein [Bacteroidales bacterium]HXK81930.1 DUF4249 family protein [Bacteroidales bacterium]